MLLNMYLKGALADQAYRKSQNPLEIAGWFDRGNYSVKKNPSARNLWIQGGPRA